MRFSIPKCNVSCTVSTFGQPIVLGIDSKGTQYIRGTWTDFKEGVEGKLELFKKAAVYGASQIVDKRVARSDERTIELASREGKSDRGYQIVIAPTGRELRGNLNEIRRDNATRESLEAEAKLNKQVASAEAAGMVRGKVIRRGGSR